MLHRLSEYAENQGSAPNRLIPSPVTVDLKWSTPIPTDDTWQIVSEPEETNVEATYFNG